MWLAWRFRRLTWCQFRCSDQTTCDGTTPEAPSKCAGTLQARISIRFLPPAMAYSAPGPKHRLGKNFGEKGAQLGASLLSCCTFARKSTSAVKTNCSTTAAIGRFCSLIPGLGVKLSNDHPCRAHCSLRGRGEPSA